MEGDLHVDLFRAAVGAAEVMAAVFTGGSAVSVVGAFQLEVGRRVFRAFAGT